MAKPPRERSDRTSTPVHRQGVVEQLFSTPPNIIRICFLITSLQYNSTICKSCTIVNKTDGQKMTTAGERNVLRLRFAKFLYFLHIFSDINANTFDFRQIICYIYFAKQFLQSLSGVRTFLFLKFIFFHTTGEFLQKCKLRLRLCAFPYHVRIVWRQSEFAFWCVGSCRRIFVLWRKCRMSISIRGA